MFGNDTITYSALKWY